MKIIIQCARSKFKEAVKLSSDNGQEVVFVADPEKFCEDNHKFAYCHPDDQISTKRKSYREFLVEYNNSSENPLKLYRAGDLYQPNIYKELTTNYGYKNVYILSAGWGLLRSDFRIPYYNITFSSAGEPGIKRLKSHKFKDFNHLKENIAESDEFFFFGGISYLPLLYKLTKDLPGYKHINYASKNVQKINGFEYIYHKPYTNWHYQCARDFLNMKTHKTLTKN